MADNDYLYSQEAVLDLVFNNPEDEQLFMQASNENNPEIVDSNGLSQKGQAVANSIIDEATSKEIDIDNPDILKKSNRMDPVVIMDPSMPKPRFTTEFIDQELNKLSPGLQSTENMTKVNGIAWPLISVANHNVKPEYILKMKVYFTEMIPHIYLKLDERAKDIFVMQDNPSMSDTINVTIVPAAQNKYKNISMKFKNIGGGSENSQYIEFYGEMYCPAFMTQSKNKGIGSSQLSTFDLVRLVALECNLGFQCTCPTVVDKLNDKESRVIYNKTFRAFLEDQVYKGGKNETELFDLWVDPYYYLTLVDLPYIFNKENDTNQVYVNYTQVGIITSEKYFPDPKFKLTYRTLYNIHHGGAQTNLEIANFNIETNNSFSVKQSISEYSVNENKLLEQQDVQVKDGAPGSNDSNIQETEGSAETVTMQFKTTNNSQNSQKIYRETWLNKRRQTRYKVTMRYPNLGLQRGTFVKLVILVTQETQKSQILTKISNLSSDGANLKEKLKVIRDENIPIMDPFMSGVYYIDGIEFEYGQGITIMEQHLYLIKRDDAAGRMDASSILPSTFELDRKSEQAATTPSEAMKDTSSQLTGAAGVAARWLNEIAKDGKLDLNAIPNAGAKAAEAQASTLDSDGTVNAGELPEVTVTPQGTYVKDPAQEKAEKDFLESEPENWYDLLGFGK